MSLTIFVAEIGDKTQIATLLFASDRSNQPWAVFAASSFALVLGAALTVALGASVRNSIDNIPLKLIAGIAFIALGLWSLYDHFRTA